jgi:hypothetical protein
MKKVNAPSRSYSQQLQTAMKKRGHTKEDVRNYCGCTYTSAVDNWLAGRNFPARLNQLRLHALYPELPVNPAAKNSPNGVSRPRRGQTQKKPVTKTVTAKVTPTDGFQLDRDMVNAVLAYGLDRTETLVGILRNINRLEALNRAHRS